MDDWWKKAYRGDKGVPQADAETLVATWTGCFAFAAVAWFHSQSSNLYKNLPFNWSDNRLKFDQQKWKNIIGMKPRQKSLSSPDK